MPGCREISILLVQVPFCENNGDHLEASEDSTGSMVVALGTCIRVIQG